MIKRTKSQILAYHKAVALSMEYCRVTKWVNSVNLVRLIQEQESITVNLPNDFRGRYCFMARPQIFTSFEAWYGTALTLISGLHNMYHKAWLLSTIEDKNE